MKVAIDAGPLYGHRTGVGMAADGIITALGRRDDVDLVPYLVSGRSEPQPGHRKLPLPGIVASQVWSRADRPRADRWLDRADLVHGTNYVVPPTRLPTVVSVYDCWFLRYPERATALVRRAGRNLRRAVARGAWIHTSSAATEMSARELLDTDRVVTIHLGPPNHVGPPDPGTTEAGIPPRVSGLEGARFIVAIGTEERRKGVPMLVGAFAELAADDAETRLVLAGAPGDDSTAIDNALDAVPDANRVHRLGPVDDATKAWLLRHAAVLAYPSIDEGFGFPILEAQMAGTPIVASAVGSITEVAGEGAILVDDPDRSPSTFASSLAAVLTGPGRLELIEAGHRNVKRFDWGTTASELVDLYATALGSGS